MEKLRCRFLTSVLFLLGVHKCLSLQCGPYQASEYISMSFGADNKLTATSINGTVSGGTKTTVVIGDGITLGVTGSIQLTGLSRATMCFHNPGICSQGFTLSIILNFDHSKTLTFLSNGADATTSYGTSLSFTSNTLTAKVATFEPFPLLKKHMWTTTVTMPTLATDYFVSITFTGSVLTLHVLYIDGTNTVQELTNTQSSSVTSSVTSPSNSYYIGKAGFGSQYGEGNYDDLLFWEEVKPLQYIKDVIAAQNSTQCVVSCTSAEGSGKHLSCFACNLYWDCSTGALAVCMQGQVFNDVTKQCEATSPTCPSLIIPVGNNTLDCFPTPCDTAPCQNSGTCVNMEDGWLCECNATAVGWTGDQCEVNYDECQTSLNKCVWNNTASCTDGVGGLNNFTCACNPGYNLTDCSNYDNCLATPCQNSGTCTDDLTTDNYTCTCVPGYIGYNCETDYNECSSNPCQNGGQCNDQVNQYNCTCSPGYSGIHCEFYDDCFYDPCVNGTCSDLNNTVSNDYVCTCINGFSGQNCSIENECVTQNVTCLNGAVCQDLVGAWQCNCVAGYDGTYCGNNIDECSTAPCLNGGTCSDLINDYSCNCVTGYLDKNCSTNFDECSSSPCQNSGTCTDLINDFNCTCAIGYSGSVCELYDECTATPCQSSATCTDPNLGASNDYNCNCMAGFYGRSCENENGCISQNVVCQNGGTCGNTTTAGIYNCQCVTGYNGTHCENNIDECASNPCQNGGQCNDQVNQYNCTCSQGYFGTHCENLNECFAAPCQNGATCTDMVNDYSCTCAGQYTGKNCTQCTTGFSNPGCSVEDKCITQNVVCQNGGVCHTLMNNFQCNCTAGYKGTYCNITDECILYNNPCQNGGNCTDLTNDYSCACLNGYSSKNCTSENKCITQNVNCLNGGTCQPADASCQCTTNFVGSTCQNDDPCYPNPCQNAGSCALLSGVGTYQCTCPVSHNGTHCENSPCTAVQCQNNGTCVVSSGQKNCVCDSTHTGEFCQNTVVDPNAGAQVDEANTGWKGATIAFIVILIIIIVVIVVVVVVIGYKYHNRNNKVNPGEDTENPDEEDDPIAAILAGNAYGADPEGGDSEFQPSNETAAATFDGGDGSIIAATRSDGEMLPSTFPPINHRLKPNADTIGKTRELEGPVVGGTPPPGYNGPTPVES